MLDAETGARGLKAQETSGLEMAGVPYILLDPAFDGPVAKVLPVRGSEYWWRNLKFDHSKVGFVRKGTTSR